MKNAFYFNLKAIFVLKIFKFLPGLFGGSRAISSQENCSQNNCPWMIVLWIIALRSIVLENNWPRGKLLPGKSPKRKIDPAKLPPHYEISLKNNCPHSSKFPPKTATSELRKICIVY